MSTPSLHEIAAMPFPASQNAMRKHYNPDWGKPVPDGADRPRNYSVVVSYIVHTPEYQTVTVSAFSEAEAAEKAEEEVMKGEVADDIEVIDCHVEEREPASC